MNSSDERARILRMVAEGTVSPAEGEDLLSALDTPRGSEGGPGGTAGNQGPQLPPAPLAPPRPVPPRNLIIRVSEDGDKKVNVRIPLALARAAGKFIPHHAHEYLRNYGISLDEVLQSLNDTAIDGTLLEVQDDDDHIVIAVE